MSSGKWDQTQETFEEHVERFRKDRETKPYGCSHCGFETEDLVNYSRHYGGNVGGHWLCVFCRVTRSASRLGAGSQSSDDVADVAVMLNVLLREIGSAR